MQTTSGVKGSVYRRTDATTYTKIIDTTAWTVNVAELTVDTQLHNTDYITRVKGPVEWTASVEGLAQTTRSNTNFASLMIPESATTGGSTAATVTKHPIVSSDFALSRYRTDLQGYYASEAAGTADNTSASNDDWFYVIGAEAIYVYHSGSWASQNDWQASYFRDGAVWIGEQDDAGILSYFSSNTYSASTRYYTYHTDDGLFRRVELTGTTTGGSTVVPGSTLYIRFRNLSGTSPVYEGEAILSEVIVTTPADGLATISASLVGTGAIIYKEA